MKSEFGSVVGACNVCEINLWDGCGNRPAIFPCGVKGCPYETASEQANIEFSAYGSSLAQLIEESD